MDIKNVKRSCIFQFMVVAVLCVPAAAQSLSFGVKGGTPITDPFVLTTSPSSLNNYSFTKERYTVGPTFEIGLPFNLAFEADALYRRLDYVSGVVDKLIDWDAANYLFRRSPGWRS